MEKCLECGGSGVIEHNGKPHECRCALVRRLAHAMPTYIKKADVRKEHLSLPLINCMKKHVMVIGSWQDIKAVIKSLMIVNPSSLIRITSDREVRDVYVGSKSKAARGDENGAVYNSLEDLMDPPDLMLVRLNELSYKNKAASGALEEAICYRTDRDKPTWLLSDVDRPFTIGSHAYSDSVADLIKSNFPAFRIPRILPNSFSGDNPFDDLTPLEVTTTDTYVPPPMVKVEVVSPVIHTYEEPDLDPPKPKVKPKIRPSDDSDAISSPLDRYGSGVKVNKFSKGRK